MNITQMLKGLNERRGQKVKDCQALTNAALLEKRDFTADESTKLVGLQSEIEATDAQITLAIRQIGIESTKVAELSQGDEKTVAAFDIGTVLRHMKKSASGGRSELTGIELEMVQEGEREARAAGIEITGLVLPRVLVRRSQPGLETRTVLTSGTSADGGYTVQTDKVGLADSFYNASILRAAGATVLENLVGNLDLPRYTMPSDPAKKAENASADNLSPTFAQLSLSPRRLPAYIDLSDQLLRQSSAALSSFIMKALTEQMSAVQEVAFFHGGGTNEPTGIASTSGIGSVAGGTNGLAPAWSHIVDLESSVASSNAASGKLAYFINSKTRGKLKQTASNGAASPFVISYDGQLNGYTPYVSNAISSALTKGSASTCSAIFFGNAADFIIAYWGGLQLEMIRDQANAKLGQHTLVANAYYDGGVLRPKSFGAMLDVLAG